MEPKEMSFGIVYRLILVMALLIPQSALAEEESFVGIGNLLSEYAASFRSGDVEKFKSLIHEDSFVIYGGIPYGRDFLINQVSARYDSDLEKTFGTSVRVKSIVLNKEKTFAKVEVVSIWDGYDIELEKKIHSEQAETFYLSYIYPEPNSRGRKWVVIAEIKDPDGVAVDLRSQGKK